VNTNPADLQTRQGGICLNMIVKNETRVLDRLFRSVKDYIDYWVIVDTGSTDGTQQFIREWFGAAGIPGELHDRPWVNFGHNRQQALELAVASDQTDWLLFIDADEELVVTDPEALKSLQTGMNYRLEKSHGALSYFLPALVDIRQSTWCWQSPVHEYLEHLSGPKDFTKLAGVHIRYYAGEGARSQGISAEEKFLGDARILTKHLEHHPEDARSQFYLANSYKDAGHFDKAYEAYRTRCSMPGWAEENFMARLWLGSMAIKLNKPDGLILDHMLEAYAYRPSRAEPLYELARHYRLRKQFARAFFFAHSGSRITLPQDTLFVSHQVYQWQMLDELGVSAYWAGAYEISLQACDTLLQRVSQGMSVPQADLDRIRQNRQYSVEKVRGV
jgi:glycosyltransferase involved in cell wall biosynthesis